MRSKKTGIILTAFLLVFIILPFQVSASPGRLAALGLATGTSWMLGTDEGYFFINPAVLQKLRPQVWADLWTFDAGLLLNMGGSFNLYLVTGLPVSTASFTGVPATPIPAMTQELMRAGAGFTAGKMDVGISLFTAGTSYSDATNNDQDLMAGLNGGIVLSLSQSLSLDAAAGINYWSIQRHFTPANDYVATPLDIALRARLNMILAQSNTLRIFAQYNSGNRDYTLAGTTTARSTTNLMGGLSDEMALSDAVMIFAGAYVDASLFAVAAGNTNTYTVNANAGSEVSLSKDVTARLGIQKTFATVTYVSATNQAVDLTSCSFGWSGPRSPVARSI